MDNRVYTVTEINKYLKKVLDSNPYLSGIYIQGEISNYKRYPSGHHYFSLKDSGGVLKCVMFSSDAFNLKFVPENGLSVVAFGRISVYPRDGQYQLYITSLIPAGVGSLTIAFEQLKEKLQKEGLFEASHKKELPRFPSRIALVTSPAGAAVRDMLRILRARWPIASVMIAPVKVQGQGAAEEIAEAIQNINKFQLADLIIVGRGGGSIEDLWAFNEEIVARSIYASEIPVISGVGHEPDFTISDFVADLRAATPSNAAELAVPDKNDIAVQLSHIHTRIYESIVKKIRFSRNLVTSYSQRPVLKSPLNIISEKKLRLDYLMDKFDSAVHSDYTQRRERLIHYISSLNALSPLNVLLRGYSITYDESNQSISDATTVSEGQRITTQVKNGKIISTINEVIKEG